MSRFYYASFDGVSVSAIQDLFEILGPADAVTRIHEIRIENGDSETSEQLRVQVTRDHTTSGTGGTTVTPRAVSEGDGAYGGTVEANNTTQATGGTPIVLLAGAFNVLNGWHWLPTPEGRIDLSPSVRCVLELPVAPAAATVMSGYMLIEEIGG